MIKTVLDFDKTVNSITKDIDKKYNKEIKLQKEVLNSDNFNDTFKNIEIELNALYEKTRTLNDIIDYAKVYIRNTTDNIKTECNSIINNIQSNHDKAKNQSYIYYNADFSMGEGSFIDRDGSELPRADLCNGTVILSGVFNNSIHIKEIVKLSNPNNNLPINETLKNLINNKPYRATYLLDKTVKDGLKEVLKITLDKESEINYLKIDTANCSVEYVKYINSHTGTTFTDNEFKSGIVPAKNITDIEIAINSKNYELVQLQGPTVYFYKK